jgi:PAS domain-containing protein
VAIQPLELILARNLISEIEIAAFLVDRDGAIPFWNEAAGELLGHPFEEVGRMEWTEWTNAFSAVDESGSSLDFEHLPLAEALRAGMAASGRFCIEANEEPLEIETAALPLVGAEGYQGAIVTFWISNGKSNGKVDPAGYEGSA